jgi:hypothetical protein
MKHIDVKMRFSLTKIYNIFMESAILAKISAANVWKWSI